MKALPWMLVAMMVASGSGAAGGCSSCPPSTQVVPLLPPSGDGGPGGTVDVAQACKRFCSGSEFTSCTETTIQVEGQTLPAIRCTFQPSCVD